MAKRGVLGRAAKMLGARRMCLVHPAPLMITDFAHATLTCGLWSAERTQQYHSPTRGFPRSDRPGNQSRPAGTAAADRAAAAICRTLRSRQLRPRQRCPLPSPFGIGRRLIGLIAVSGERVRLVLSRVCEPEANQKR